MQSWQVVEWGKPLQPMSYPDPVPQGTDVLVRLSGCGVCHSDLHQADGYFDLGGGKRISLEARGNKLPYTPGHEMAGEVQAVGPDVTDVKPGDRGIVFPWIGCGECESCASGKETYCEKTRFLGGTRDGGYSTHVLIPHGRYIVPYGDIDPDYAGTLACSGATAYGALTKIPPTTEDDHIVIIGAGGVGTSGMLIAPAVHQAKLIVADVDEAKLAAARTSNRVSMVVNARDPAAAVAEVMKATGKGAAAAIDFVGSPNSARFGLDSLRRGGTLICVGLYGGELPLSLPLVPMRSQNIRGSLVGTLAEFHDLMKLVRAGKVPPIRTEQRPLSAANEAMTELRSGKVIGRLVLKP
jgi:D-arabinose 1-dehydrogenase-like Zn-dependent alcohol dehydrogenase